MRWLHSEPGASWWLATRTLRQAYLMTSLSGLALVAYAVLALPVPGAGGFARGLAVFWLAFFLFHLHSLVRLRRRA